MDDVEVEVDVASANVNPLCSSQKGQNRG